MALLVEREVHWRSDKKRERLMKEARLKYPQAAIEDLDTRSGRSIERKAIMSLVLGDWIDSGHSVLITGPTGAGKSWLALPGGQLPSSSEEDQAHIIHDGCNSPEPS
jgi:DNA replication protein DnaC